MTWSSMAMFAPSAIMTNTEMVDPVELASVFTGSFSVSQLRRGSRESLRRILNEARRPAMT